MDEDVKLVTTVRIGMGGPNNSFRVPTQTITKLRRILGHLENGQSFEVASETTDKKSVLRVTEK